MSKKYLLFFFLPALILAGVSAAFLMSNGSRAGQAVSVDYGVSTPEQRDGDVLSLSWFKTAPGSSVVRRVFGVVGPSAGTAHTAAFKAAANHLELESVDPTPTQKYVAEGSVYAAAVLSMYVDHIDPSLLNGRVVAITGSADTYGASHTPLWFLPVSGVPVKFDAAVAAGADVLIAPAGSGAELWKTNNPDFQGDVVTADNLAGVINYLTGVPATGTPWLPGHYVVLGDA